MCCSIIICLNNAAGGSVLFCLLSRLISRLHAIRLELDYFSAKVLEEPGEVADDFDIITTVGLGAGGGGARFPFITRIFGDDSSSVVSI